MVGGLSATIWLSIFHLSHEYTPANIWQIRKFKKVKTIESGYYRFIEWPYGGSFMKQKHRLIEYLDIIKSEYSKIEQEKLRHG